MWKTLSSKDFIISLLRNNKIYHMISIQFNFLPKPICTFSSPPQIPCCPFPFDTPLQSQATPPQSNPFDTWWWLCCTRPRQGQGQGQDCGCSLSGLNWIRPLKVSNDDIGWFDIEIWSLKKGWFHIERWPLKKVSLVLKDDL